MAATGYTPISLYYSTTASAVPTAGNLANGELALNIADMKLYAKNSAGTVTLLASNASTTGVDSLSFGSTGLTPSTATTGAITVAGTLNVANGGTGQTSFTANRLLYGNGTGGLNSSAGLTFDGTTLGVTGPLNLAGTSTFPTSGLMLRSGDNQLKVVAGSAGIAFAAASGASTYATIDSAGNLGLGVTPSAWVGSKALQVKGVGAFYADGESYAYTTGVANNCYQTGNGTWAYRVAATNAGRYEQNGNAHAWYSSSGAPSAGGAVSFTQAMTLGSSGDLLLGTTTNRLGEKLHVLGNGIVTSTAENTNLGLFGNFGSSNLIIGTFNSFDLEIRTGNTARFFVNTSGAFGIGSGGGYGTAGQVLTSQGSSSAPTWAAAGGGSQAFVAFGSTGGM